MAEEWLDWEPRTRSARGQFYSLFHIRTLVKSDS